MNPPRILPLALGLLSTPAFALVSIDWVTVGNPGNAPDTLVGADNTTGYGAVDYEYRISRNETTIAQYAEFLNAVAATDEHGLYNPAMGADLNSAGIRRSGEPGGYSYDVIGSGKRPITYVSWFDAARFANWMHNGQGAGSTETGVYRLDGPDTGNLRVQAGAKVWIPTENEWYKAAYYDPEKNDGAGGYWLYPNRSNTIPGNSPGTPGAANFFDGSGAGFAVTQSGVQSDFQNYLTDVGAYGESSRSYYGTNDQAGNVYEWNSFLTEDSMRGARGGCWVGYLFSWEDITAYRRTYWDPASEGSTLGFRLAGGPIVRKPTELVANGSFEKGADYDWGQLEWDGRDHVAVFQLSDYAPTEGRRLLVFNGSNEIPDGRVSQMVLTNPGDTYTLSFDVGTYSFVNSQQRLLVSLEGKTTVLKQMVTSSGIGGGRSSWRTESYTFTADSHYTYVHFRDCSATSDGIDLLLDNISIRGPEPGPRPPLARPDRISGLLSPIPLTFLLNNDLDMQGGPMEVRNPTQPEHGTITLSPDGVYLYHPTPGFVGYDRFTYIARNSVGESDPAPVTIESGSSDVSLNDDGSFECFDETYGLAGNVRIGKLPDGQASEGSSSLIFNDENSAPNGIVTFWPTVEYESYNHRIVERKYRLRFDVCSIGYHTATQAVRVGVFLTWGNFRFRGDRIVDRQVSVPSSTDGSAAWQTVEITFFAYGELDLVFEDTSTLTNSADLLLDNVLLERIDDGGNTPPSVADDFYTVRAGQSLAVSASEGILSNESDPDGDKIVVDPVSYGSAVNGIQTLDVRPDGSFQYTPPDGFIGTVTRGLTIHDDFSRLWTNLYLTVEGPSWQKLRNGDFSDGLVGWGGNAVQAPSQPDQGAQKFANLEASNYSVLCNQSFPVRPGRHYRFLFDYALVGTDEVQSLEVSARSASISYLFPVNPGESFQSNLSVQGTTSGTEWHSFQFEFQPSDVRCNLDFRRRQLPQSGSFLIRSVRVIDLDEMGSVLTSVRMTGGEFPAVSIEALDPGFYLLEASDNLKTWQPLERREVSAPGPVRFVDPPRPFGDTTPTFYRVGLEYGH